jgi:hypothetical protein
MDERQNRSAPLGVKSRKPFKAKEDEMEGDNPYRPPLQCDKSPTRTRPPVPPGELRRFKLAGWFVLALAAAALLIIFRYGDSARQFVDRLNAFVLGPLVAAMFIIITCALLRFRRACRAYVAEASQIRESGETQG